MYKELIISNLLSHILVSLQTVSDSLEYLAQRSGMYPLSLHQGITDMP